MSLHSSLKDYRTRELEGNVEGTRLAVRFYRCVSLDRYLCKGIVRGFICARGARKGARLEVQGGCVKGPRGFAWVSVCSFSFTTCAVAVAVSLASCNSSSTGGQTVSISPTALTLHPGDQGATITVKVGIATHSDPINVTLALPSGITASPLTIVPGQSTGTVTLNASETADAENFKNDTPVALMSHTQTVLVSATDVPGPGLTSTNLQLTVSLENPSFTPAPSDINIPIVNINTGGAPIADKVTNVPGSITITSADGKTSYLPNSSDTDNTATFHLHGNSTILMPKKPYHFKLNTSLDLLNTMGVSCPYTTGKKATCDKSKTYDLLANYDDKTFLRDWAALSLANSIPMTAGYLTSPANSPSPSGTATVLPWAPHSVFVELFVNGEYEGNYQLIEEVKVDSHRVNITELSETDTAPADVTGGYLMEIDLAHHDEAYVFNTPHGVVIGLEDPDFTPDPEIPSQTAYISSYVTTAENALFGSNFTDPTLGWRAYFDEAAAVNFYIVNEVTGNVDGGDFASSDYLYKDANNPLIYMGPVWDFDVSSGNVNWAPISNPTIPWMSAEPLVQAAVSRSRLSGRRSQTVEQAQVRWCS
jgi:CotH kinase protein